MDPKLDPLRTVLLPPLEISIDTGSIQTGCAFSRCILCSFLTLKLAESHPSAVHTLTELCFLHPRF